MIPITCAELVSTVAYAIRRNMRLLSRRRDETDVRILAKAIVDHLELCRWSTWRQEPGAGHRTPGGTPEPPSFQARDPLSDPDRSHAT
jgi:hypothetical protein